MQRNPLLCRRAGSLSGYRRRGASRSSHRSGLIGTGQSEEADIVDLVRIICCDGGHYLSQHRVLGNLTVRKHFQSLFKFRGCEILLVPALLKTLLKMRESSHCRWYLKHILPCWRYSPRRRLGQPEQRCSCQQAQIIAQSTYRHRFGALAGYPHVLIFVIVRFEFGPSLGHAQPKLLIYRLL